MRSALSYSMSSQMNDIQQLVYDMEVLTTRDRPPTFDNWEDFVELIESRPAETMRIDWDNEAIAISEKETYWTIVSKYSAFGPYKQKISNEQVYEWINAGLLKGANIVVSKRSQIMGNPLSCSMTLIASSQDHVLEITPNGMF